MAPLWPVTLSDRCPPPVPADVCDARLGRVQHSPEVCVSVRGVLLLSFPTLGEILRIAGRGEG